MSDPLTYEIENKIAVVQMDDGKANALSMPMIEALMWRPMVWDRNVRLYDAPVRRACTTRLYDAPVRRACTTRMMANDCGRHWAGSDEDVRAR